MRNVRGGSGSTGLAGLGDFWWSLEFAARMGDKNPQRDRPTTPDADLRIRGDYISQPVRLAFGLQAIHPLQLVV
jgi:hypothetical protein